MKHHTSSFGASSIVSTGFLLGLPLYIVGMVLKTRNGLPFQSALLGFHLGVLIYLILIGPLIIALLMMT
jgi:hypothetical protein